MGHMLLKSLGEVDYTLTKVNAWAGEMFVISTDQTVSKDIKVLGHWAWDHVEIFKSLLEEGDTFVDVGAFIGHHSVAILNAFRNRVRVVSVEGQVEYARILKMNLDLQRFPNFRVLHVVASSKAGYCDVPIVDLNSNLNFGSLSYAEVGEEFGAEKSSVPQIKLDTELSIEKSVGLIKIDVQTFELFVLQGSLEILNRDFPHLFVEISPYLMMTGAEYDYRRIYSLLIGNGYLLFDVLGNQLSVDLIRDPFSYPRGLEWDIVAIHSTKIKVYKKIPWMD